ncbi:MAG: cell division protein FtsA [Muribaculaceae bacterium]|nr:cell division protein FtsA [Muribaculaceae bacterium]
MKKETYIAALEISSSKVIGAVGIIGSSGQIHIIAAEQEKYTDTVRYGQVQNTEETYELTNYVLERLERRPDISPREISGVYAGISGRSLRSIPVDVSLSLPDDTEISENIVERLKKEALETEIDNSLEIIDAVPRIFHIGKTDTHRPIGSIANGISATYDLIVARPALQNNLRRVIADKLGLELKGTVVTPLATGAIALTEQEKKLGCMLVDMGAETTTVTIYTRGNLAYFATLPLGGRNITRDLTSLNELEEKAEELKLSVGNAIAPLTPSQVQVGRHKQSDISNLVVARSEEIAANIVEQIHYAGLSEKDIPEGIVLCGGAARLNGMVELLVKFSGLKVRMASLPSFIHIEDARTQGLEMLQIAAIIHAASQKNASDCLMIPEPETPDDVHDTQPATHVAPEPSAASGETKQKKPSFFSRIGSTFGKMFTPIGDDDEGEELN